MWPTTYLSPEECCLGCGLRIYSDPHFDPDVWQKPEPLSREQLTEIETALEKRQLGDKRQVNYHMDIKAGDPIPTTNSVVAIPGQESENTQRYIRVVQVKNVSPHPPHPDKPYSIYFDGTLLPASYMPPPAPSTPKRQVGRPRKVRRVSYEVANVAR